MRHVISDDLSIYALVDARPAPVAVTWSFPDVEEGAWDGLLCPGTDAEGRFAPNLGCFLLRMGSTTILCDAGIGPGPNAYLGGLAGRLPALLADLDLDVSAIDAVVFTHLHMDHIGWAGAAEGASFPNAAYYVPSGDLDYFNAGAPGTGRHHAAAFEACLRPLADAGQVAALDEGAEIMPGLRYLATPGHTPGHQSILAEGQGGTLCITGDVFHCPAQVERPDWSHRADLDADAARRSRRELIGRAAEGRWILAAGHFRDTLQFGRIASNGQGQVWRPEAA